MPETCNDGARVAVDRRRLVAGRPLPGNLYDHKGRVLFRAGQMLDAGALRMLEMYDDTGVFGDEQWQTPRARAASASAPVPEQPEQVAQLRRSGEARRMRAHQRYCWRSRVPVVFEEPSSDGMRRRQALVRTLDVSAGGFAFEFDQYVHPGTIVHAAFHALKRNPQRRGIVRSCVHVDGTTHRVGVEFSTSAAATTPQKSAPSAATPADSPAAAGAGLAGEPAAAAPSGSLTPPVCPAG
jgi:hypothetical protein